MIVNISADTQRYSQINRDNRNMEWTKEADESIQKGVQGYRVQLGGKLGRHPQLAKELPGIYDEDQVLHLVNDCLHIYTQNSKHGERFGQILTSADFEEIAARYKH